MDDLLLLLVFVGGFSLALVMGEFVVTAWRKIRQRMWFPPPKGGKWR